VRIARATFVAALALTGCAASEPLPPAYPAPPAPAWSAPAAPAPYEWGEASFYSDRLAGRPTAAGEPYDPRAYTAAHRTLPLGTVVQVTRDDGRAVTVRINDRGPHARGRILDLSHRAAGDLGMIRQGVALVTVRVLWVPPPRMHRL